MDALLQASPLARQYALILLLGCLVVWFAKRTRNRLPLPPGPTGLPIVGNMLDFPSEKPWLKYMEWMKEYNSDILSFKVISQTAIIISSADIAHALMDKRSDVYSDRPCSTMDRLCGWLDWNMVIQPYGSTWRIGRRYLHEYFRRGIIHQYHAAQRREVRAFLRRALEFKGNIKGHTINQVFAALTMDITYGMTVSGPEDSFILRIEKSAEEFGKMKMPGAFLADIFPILQYIPAWCPGGSAQRVASKHRPLAMSLKDEPFDVVKADMAHGINKHRIAHRMLEQLEIVTDANEHAFLEMCASGAAMVAYGAGVETSYSTTSWFLVAMAMYPKIQAKAQEELDNYLGLTRLPELEDRDYLPYFRALLMEVLRWRPTVPLGLPHRLMVDDQYEGYHLPAGAMIVPNVWAMFHNPEDYPDPDSFSPDRFLKDGQIDPNVRDPSEVAFGFGRRCLALNELSHCSICPGRHFAKDAIFLLFASILSVYNISPAVDGAGNPIPVDADSPGAGVLLHPKSLTNCVLKPRSKAAEALIEGIDISGEAIL